LDKNCIFSILIRFLNFSGICNPERNKSINPIKPYVHQKYVKVAECSLYPKKSRNSTIDYHNCLRKSIASISLEDKKTNKG